MSRDIGGRPWARLRKTILDRDGWRCAYCGKDLRQPGARPQVDHMNPREFGGTDDPSNLVGCCGKCNHDKGNMRYEDWLAKIGKAPRTQQPTSTSRPPGCPGLNIGSRNWTGTLIQCGNHWHPAPPEPRR